MCGAGMSTSLLVLKMEEAIKEAGDEAEVLALPINDGINKMQDYDCILIGPQIRFEIRNVEKKLKELGLTCPYDVINMRDYGMMDGKKIYAYAKKLMGE